ncbi:DNA replication licensing factor mcm2 [Nosema bombycis CQ1]|uniref:DNA replication licensing factor mcm2 n=1 Tax=Nosema bombycis (strain CQ1 / CVCC 102059) TaxID=578461 RepID=R0M563_NOSB1|nr:DNA replication licensing factor mcm2 [Nosema bombycis CQ1]|eukprot:EOB13149.1 DNA replication licensing factor mcm2 [Nosema bombycis CQ1]
MSKRKYFNEKENFSEQSEEEEMNSENHSENDIIASDNGIVEEMIPTADHAEGFSDLQQYSEIDTYFDNDNTHNSHLEDKNNADEIMLDEEFKKIIESEKIDKKYFENSFFRTKIENVFCDFLNSKKYTKDIRTMCSENLESLYIEYKDIDEYSSDLLRLVETYPESMFSIMDSALERVVKIYFVNYSHIKPKLHCRIKHIPVTENIRSLRNNHLNRLVKIRGVVTRRTGVFPLYYIIKYTCLKCQATFGPFIANNTKPTSCFECQSKGPFTVNSAETIYKDFQKLTIQEVPGTVPPGTLPRSKESLKPFLLIKM